MKHNLKQSSASIEVGGEKPREWTYNKYRLLGINPAGPILVQHPSVPPHFPWPQTFGHEQGGGSRGALKCSRAGVHALGPPSPGTLSPHGGAGGSHHAALSRRNAAGGEEGEEEEIGFLSTLETKAALFINFHKY